MIKMEDIEVKLKENQELDEELAGVNASKRVCAAESGLLTIMGGISLSVELAQQNPDKLPVTITLLGLAGVTGIISLLSFIKARQISKKIADNNEYIAAVKKDHEDAISR